MSSRPPPLEPFTVLDRIGTGITVFPVAALLFFHALAGRAFAQMFRDFGALGALPPLTALSISWWFPAVLGLAPLGALVRGVLAGTPVPERRTWIVGAFLMACVGLAVCTAGVYLPIFDLAGKIKADDAP